MPPKKQGKKGGGDGDTAEEQARALYVAYRKTRHDKGRGGCLGLVRRWLRRAGLVGRGGVRSPTAPAPQSRQAGRHALRPICASTSMASKSLHNACPSCSDARLVKDLEALAEAQPTGAAMLATAKCKVQVGACGTEQY